MGWFLYSTFLLSQRTQTYNMPQHSHSFVRALVFFLCLSASCLTFALRYLQPGMTCTLSSRSTSTSTRETFKCLKMSNYLCPGCGSVFKGRHYVVTKKAPLIKAMNTGNWLGFPSVSSQADWFFILGTLDSAVWETLKGFRTQETKVRAAGAFFCPGWFLMKGLF